jgi:hypothetical protein
MEETVALGRLTSYDQWKPWLSYIKAIAIETQIWQEIDPSQSSEPQRPLPPSKPTPSEIQEEAQSTRDLTDKQIARYRDLLSIYNLEKGEYDQQSKARQAILGIIERTIDPKYKPLLLGQRSPYQQLRTLYELFQASDRTHIQMLRKKWQDLMRTGVTHNIVDQWINQVHQQYIEGIAVGVPEIQHQDSVIFDILYALKDVAPSFCDIWYHEVFNKSKSIKVPQFIRIFQGQRGFQSTGPAVSIPKSQGAFSTWQGHPEAKQLYRCVCGKLHPYQRCYYLNPSVRPPNLQPQQQVIEAIKNKLQNNAILADIQKELPDFKGLEETPYKHAYTAAIVSF